MALYHSTYERNVGNNASKMISSHVSTGKLKEIFSENDVISTRNIVPKMEEIVKTCMGL